MVKNYLSRFMNIRGGTDPIKDVSSDRGPGLPALPATQSVHRKRCFLQEEEDQIY
jgi:hypothetical protein